MSLAHRLIDLTINRFQPRYSLSATLQLQNPVTSYTYNYALEYYGKFPIVYDYDTNTMSRLHQAARNYQTNVQGGNREDQFFNQKFCTQTQYTAIFNAFKADANICPVGYNDAQLANMTLRIALVFADMGTSSATNYNGVQFPNATRAANMNFQRIVDAIRTQTTVRRFARQLADMVFAHAKQHKMQFAVGAAHGIPKDYGYLGFDFADGIDPSTLSVEEALCIDASKRVGLYKAAATQVTNTTALFHHGTAPPSRAPQGLITG